jgi:hypothetical protein
MHYVIQGLDPAAFAPLFELDEAALASRGIMPMRVDSAGYPCRISLENAPLHDRVLLLHYEHHTARSPFRASHAIFVAASSRELRQYHNTIPPALESRLLSIRAFDRGGMMLDAAVVAGAEAEPVIAALFSCEGAHYLHAHYAKQGCFAAEIRRL